MTKLHIHFLVFLPSQSCETFGLLSEFAAVANLKVNIPINRVYRSQVGYHEINMDNAIRPDWKDYICDWYSLVVSGDGDRIETKSQRGLRSTCERLGQLVL